MECLALESGFICKCLYEKFETTFAKLSKLFLDFGKLWILVYTGTRKKENSFFAWQIIR